MHLSVCSLRSDIANSTDVIVKKGTNSRQAKYIYRMSKYWFCLPGASLRCVLIWYDAKPDNITQWLTIVDVRYSDLPITRH